MRLLSTLCGQLITCVSTVCNIYKEYSQCNTALLCAFSVIIHIVSRCHEEGLEHYLRSFVKVTDQKLQGLH